MAIHFTADEVFEMAGQIERNGARFYRKAAASVADAGMRDLLRDLAAREDEHEKTFAGMRAELTEEERRPSNYDPEGESTLYLRAVADGNVFNIREDPTEQLTGKETAEDIIRAAILLERDSIDFYLGMREQTPRRWGKERMDDIIREEMSHVSRLRRELEGLSKA